MVLGARGGEWGEGAQRCSSMPALPVHGPPCAHWLPLAVVQVLLAYSSHAHLYPVCLIAGICYGGYWSLMPTICTDLFGIKHLGMVCLRQRAAARAEGDGGGGLRGPGGALPIGPLGMWGSRCNRRMIYQGPSQCVVPGGSLALGLLPPQRWRALRPVRWLCFRNAKHRLCRKHRCQRGKGRQGVHGTRILGPSADKQGHATRPATRKRPLSIEQFS